MQPSECMSRWLAMQPSERMCTATRDPIIKVHEDISCSITMSLVDLLLASEKLCALFVEVFRNLLQHSAGVVVLMQWVVVI